MTAEFANPITEAQGFIADFLFSDEVRAHPLVKKGYADDEVYELDRAARIMRSLLALVPGAIPVELEFTQLELPL